MESGKFLSQSVPYYFCARLRKALRAATLVAENDTLFKKLTFGDCDLRYLYYARNSFPWLHYCKDPKI